MEEVKKLEEELESKRDEFLKTTQDFELFFESKKQKAFKFLNEQKEYLFWLEHEEAEKVNNSHKKAKIESEERRLKFSQDELKKSQELLSKRIEEFENSKRRVVILNFQKSEVEKFIELKKNEISILENKKLRSPTSPILPSEYDSKLKLYNSEISRLSQQRIEVLEEIDECEKRIKLEDSRLRQEETNHEVFEGEKELYVEKLIEEYEKVMDMLKKQTNDCKKSLDEKSKKLEKLEDKFDKFERFSETSAGNIKDYENEITEIKKYISESQKKLEILKKKKIENNYISNSEKNFKILENMGFRDLEEIEKKLYDDYDLIINNYNPKYLKFLEFLKSVNFKIKVYRNLKSCIIPKVLEKLSKILVSFESSNPSSNKEIISRIEKIEFFEKSVVRELSKKIDFLNTDYLSSLKHRIHETIDKLRNTMDSRFDEINEIKDTRSKIISEITSELLEKKISFSVVECTRYSLISEILKLCEGVDGEYESIFEILGSLETEKVESFSNINNIEFTKMKKEKLGILVEWIHKFQGILKSLESENLLNLKELKKRTEMEYEPPENLEEMVEENKGKWIREIDLLKQKMKYVSDKIRIISDRKIHLEVKIFLENSYGSEIVSRRIEKIEEEIKRKNEEIEVINKQILEEERNREDEDEFDYELELIKEAKIDKFYLLQKIDEKNIKFTEIPQKLKPLIVIEEQFDISINMERRTSSPILLIVPSPSANRRPKGLMSPTPHINMTVDVFKN